MLIAVTDFGALREHRMTDQLLDRGLAKPPRILDRHGAAAVDVDNAVHGLP
jgi:hypothetical protein